MSSTQPNVPTGFCECGCGAKTKLATKTSSRRGVMKGEPVRFAPGHNPRGRYGQLLPTLSEHRKQWEDAGVPYGLCLCGCGEATPISTRNRAGHSLRGEPHTYRRGHHNRRTVVEYAELDYVLDEAGCWIWQRALDGDGYGSCTRDGRGWRAHQWYFVQHVGPVPEGLELDHLCRVRHCVNPAHLEPVPHVVNVRRGDTTLLDEDTAAEVRLSALAGAKVARDLGVHKSTIYSIRAGATWRDEGI